MSLSFGSQLRIKAWMYFVKDTSFVGTSIILTCKIVMHQPVLLFGRVKIAFDIP